MDDTKLCACFHRRSDVIRLMALSKHARTVLYCMADETKYVRELEALWREEKAKGASNMEELVEQILRNQMLFANALNELLYPHNEEERATRIPRSQLTDMSTRTWNLLDKMKADSVSV